MAFTLEQNVQGAAAYERAINPTSSTGLALAGNLLEGLDSFARSQVRQDQAEATAARASLGTQTDRDRQLFDDLLNSARQDLTSGQDPDTVAATYAPQFASLGLNSNQESVLAQIFGEDIFAVPVQPADVADMGTTLFNDQPESVQLGLVALEIQRAEQNGENIDTETATSRAVGTLMTTTAQSQASLQAGNIDWGQGFQGNMQTLDRLGEAVSAALSVEVSGGNFNLQDLARLRAGYDMLRTQRAFMQPSGTLNAELWGQMNTKLESIENLFTAIEDYDEKDATARATALMANLALNVSQDNPMGILAMNSPEMMETIAARIAPDFAQELATNGSLLDNVVSFRDLDFDPSIVQLMGFDVEDADTPAVLQTPETVFPNNLDEAHAETLDNPNTLRRALSQLTTLNGEMASAPDQVLSTPEAREAWASNIANTSYLLSNIEQPSGANLDALLSNQNLTILRRMEAEGGEAAEQATILRQQMGQALRASSRRYATVGLGIIEKVDAVSVNPETLTIELDRSEEAARISQLVDRYYGGDFSRLLREGPSAWENLRKRLVSPENIPRITVYRNEATVGMAGLQGPTYNEEYEQFLQDTRYISPYSSDGLLWQRIISKSEDIAAVEERLQDFRRFESNLNLDTGLQSIIDSASRAIDEASTDEARIARGEIIRTELPAKGATPETAYTYDSKEGYDAIPVGSLYVNPVNGDILRKKER